MRIIAGIYKGFRINSVEGYTARPTSDFVREMMFSTLYSLIPNYDTVLDLYAGSGALGFEALSRGAREITFVEASKNSIATIISNINKLNCKEKCRIIKKNVTTTPLNLNQKFNLIFADPPYNKNLVNRTITIIKENDLLSEEGVLIVEHSKNEPIMEDFAKYVFKVKTTATITVSFINFRSYYADI